MSDAQAVSRSGSSRAAWKALEFRVAAAWGGRRRGVYRAGCDIVGAPVALERKRSKRRVPEGRWFAQAEARGRAEGLPWVLVVAGHGDRESLAVCSHAWLVELARASGLLDASAAGKVRRSRGRQGEQLPLVEVRW